MILRQNWEKRKRIIFFCSIISQNMVPFLKQGLKLDLSSDFVCLAHLVFTSRARLETSTDSLVHLIHSFMVYILMYSKNNFR